MEEGKTIYSVVDGKQRLETILKFAANEIAIDKAYGDSRLAGKKWKNIKDNEQLARMFWDYVIPVEFTNIIGDTNLVNRVFERLNRNSRRLTEQELRHANYDGWFITFVEKEAELRDWEKLGVVTAAKAKRMADVQFLSELLIVLLKGKVVGFDQEEISRYYAMYENLSDLEFPFDEDKIRLQFDLTKEFLLEMDRQNRVISEYAGDSTNLYTLWALVALHRESLPDVDTFREKYSAFMGDVNQYKDQEYLRRVIAGEETPRDNRSFRYHQYSVGASTEAPQRTERANILLEVLSDTGGLK